MNDVRRVVGLNKGDHIAASNNGTSRTSPAESRWLALTQHAARLPERLLLAHARGRVLFITGAGTSMASGLPDFRGLVLKTCERLDPKLHSVIAALSPEATQLENVSTMGLSHQQAAEVRRFVRRDYDVVLGLLERRIDGQLAESGKVRETIADLLRHVPDANGKRVKSRPSRIHRSLIRLAEQGFATTIATTNFDNLLERAGAGITSKLSSYALGGIPRPGRRKDFSGVLHIHGALSEHEHVPSDIVVTDQDFGEFYLRRRIVPDFIYDSARLFHIILVGYRADDAPMRYLLNAVAAESARFDDLKERFAFVATDGAPDQVEMEDWRGRGITPIPYDAGNSHAELDETLFRWAQLAEASGDPKKLESLVRRLVRKSRAATSEADRDLFDHLYRRMTTTERSRFASFISKGSAALDWLDAIADINSESETVSL